MRRSRGGTILRGGWTVLLAMALVACDTGPDSDLVTYVQKVKSAQPGVPDEMQVPKKHENFRYRADSEGIRDPFRGEAAPVATSRKAASGVRPDSRRGRQALEQYPLESLSMVGTMTSSKQTVALVRSGDGVIHPVHIGDYMGQNYGKVIAISASEIRLRELISDGSGGWQARPATVSLAR
jgi:type IV pilus assembly protein PilP